jgi:hypothetical protein
MAQFPKADTVQVVRATSKAVKIGEKQIYNRQFEQGWTQRSRNGVNGSEAKDPLN